MGLEDIGINAGNWIDSAQDMDYWRALVNAALNLRLFLAHWSRGLRCTTLNSFYEMYAGSILGGGGIFGEYKKSVQNQHRKKFG